MNWDAVGAVAELASAIGVLISIIYLAIQVRHNTDENKTHRNQNLVAGVADVSAQIANDPALSEIVRRGMLDFDALDEKEKFRFSFLFFSFMTKYDFSYHQYKAGKIDSGLWGRTEFELSTFIRLPGAARWWESDKPRFSPEFQEYLDLLLVATDAKKHIPAFGQIQNESSA